MTQPKGWTREEADRLHQYAYPEAPPMHQEYSADPVIFRVDDLDDANCQWTGWYFWDETWTESYGPYETEDEARTALREYVRRTLFGDYQPDDNDPVTWQEL